MEGYRILVFLTILALATARYDYVKYGRQDDGVFPSSLKNMPYYCYQAPDKGACQGAYVAYFFDIVRRQCMPMIYTGCGGNENLFRTKSECVIKCDKSRMI